MNYLRPDVLAEPLIARWYAWPHLLSPFTACLNIAQRHVAIMESFLQAPTVHEAALQDGRLAGGPFLDHPAQAVAEVQALLAHTRDRCRVQLEAAAAIRQLNDTLPRLADGGSLQAAYAQVPEVLRGLVELVYDTHHRPGVQFLEPLAYRSGLYDAGLQELAFSRLQVDHRKFVLSTPRLPGDAACILQLPFRSPLLDRLFAMMLTPGDAGALIDELAPDGASAHALRGLFTGSAPRQAERFGGPGTRVRYFGHACVCLETEAVTVLLDPLVSYDYPAAPQRFTLLDLPPRIDYVLLTHNHQDHAFIETLLRIRHRVGTVVVPRSTGGALEDPSMRQMLLQLGFADVIEVDPLDELALAGGAIVAVPFLGEHSDLRISAKTGYVVRLGNYSALFAADSRNLEPALYQRVFRDLGGTRHLFLGMACDGAPLSWLYRPLLAGPLPRHHDRARALSGSDAAMGLDLVRACGAGSVWVYAMGREPWLNHIMNLRHEPDAPPAIESDKLIRACRAAGVAADRPFARMELMA